MVSRFESFLGISSPPVAGNHSPTGAYGFVHESFPASVKLAPPRVRRNMTNFDTLTPVRKLSSEQSRKVKLPKLVFDNTPLPPRRNNNCSYISNHKSYLRLKGFQLSDVYSVNRHKPKKPNIYSSNKQSISNKIKEKDFKQSNYGFSECITTLFHPDRYYTDFHSKKKLKKENSSDLWKPYDPRSNKDTYVRSLRELDEEIPIPGYVPRDDIHHMRLGRVITSERMRELLSEEEPVIPRAFYSLDAAGVISPRYEL